MNKIKTFTILLIFFLFACQKDETRIPIPVPNTISVTESNLYPEGIAYDESQQVFYISSLTKGKVSKVSPDGTIKTFADDPTLISTLGMTIDESKNQLLVCVGDPGFNTDRSDSTTMAQFGAIAFFDLNSGDKIKQIQVASGQPILLNDLTQDTDSNIYVSDSFSPAIHKIDASGNVSTFLSDDVFIPAPNNFGLNGIAYHPDGYLIVSKYDEGKLFKVPINSPESFVEITMDTTIPSIDGIAILDETKILIASNNLGFSSHANTVFELTSTNGWISAVITNTFETGDGSFPTTFAKVDKDYYVQYAKLQQFFAGNDPMPSEFPIVKVNF